MQVCMSDNNCKSDDQIWKAVEAKLFLLRETGNGGPYHMETSPFIWRANRCNGFYMIGASVANNDETSLR